MKEVGLFIGTEELDLFDDEQISITLQLQNIADISKLFADFTQSFTIPASPRNKHNHHNSSLSILNSLNLNQWCTQILQISDYR